MAWGVRKKACYVVCMGKKSTTTILLMLVVYTMTFFWYVRFRQAASSWSRVSFQCSIRCSPVVERRTDPSTARGIRSTFPNSTGARFPDRSRRIWRIVTANWR